MITTVHPTALSEWGACLDHTHGPRFQSLATRVCEHVSTTFDVYPASLFDPRRPATVALARQVAMHLLRQKTKATLLSIGILFNRDHVTVIWAIKTVARRRETDSTFHSELLTLESHFS